MSGSAARVVGVAEAARVLSGGGLVAHPTCTVYGLGGRPRAALDREIARLKGRDASRPLIRVAAAPAEIRARVPGPWPPVAETLAGRFWPGPLTLVLPSRDGGKEGVAVRIEAHPVLRALLERAGGWMTSTSLNRHGKPAVRTVAGAADALATLGPARVPVVLLDGGTLPPSEPSTLVSFLSGRAEILREGAITREDIERVVHGEIASGSRKASGNPGAGGR